MYVVGHDDEGVELYGGKAVGKLAPDVFHDGAELRLLEEELAELCADGDEVVTGPVVVVGLEA
jgi:hypothetical protein